MNIINIDSPIGLSNFTKSLVSGITNTIDSKNKSLFLKNFNLKESLEQVPIILVSEDTFLAYIKDTMSVDEIKQFGFLDNDYDATPRLSHFAIPATADIFNSNTDAVLICPERIEKCFSANEIDDITASAILYGLAKYTVNGYDKSDIDVFFSNQENLSNAILILYLRISNENLYIKVIQYIYNNEDHYLQTINIQEEEFQNYQIREKHDISTNGLIRLSGLFDKLDLLDNSEEVKKQNKVEWETIKSKAVRASNGEWLSFNKLNKNIVAEAFCYYLESKHIEIEANGTNKSHMIANIQYFDLQLFYELFKITHVYGIENGYSEDASSIGKTAIRREFRYLNKHES